MPMKPITVKANFQLDTSAARAQLQGLQRELSSVTKGATMNLGMTEEITNAVKQAELLKQILREATDIGTGNFDLSKFTQAMNQNMTSIQKFKESLASLGPEGEKTFNSLANTIASAQVPLKRTSQGVQELMTAFGNTMRWQATSMAMHKMVGTIQQAYNYAQNLDKSLTNISIVTGHNADYMRNFAREANKAAQALSASTLEYTNASLIYYQQGLGDKEVAKRAETTLKLAKVTGDSASKVSQQMTAVWNNFSNGVDNLERYADVMAALGATTASSSSEIAKGLEKFASVTKTIGLSYDYAASALATVTAQTRQSADSVGTAFKTLFSRLESLNLGETLDDSVTLNKYSEALLKAGVNVMDVNGHLKNMDTILDELGNQWNNLNKAQQVALAQTVGGVRNYTSLITLMDNWQDFQNNVVTSQLAEGTLQQQADIYAKSWEAAQQRVKTASQGIYDTLISSDFFKGFNNAFAGILNQVNDLGKHLGTGGSLAGLMALTGYFAGDKISGRLDNAAVNFLGSTRYGQAASARAKAETFADMSRAISLNGDRDQLDTRRLNVLDATADAWKEYARVVNNNGKHGNAYISQAAMQGYYNQLSTLTERGLTAMNLSVDAKTAITTRQNVDAKAYQDLARLGSKTITGQKRPTINTSGIIDILDSNGVTQGQLNGIAQRKVLLNFQEQLNSASSPAARRGIIANMQRYVDSGLNQSVKNTGEAILKELNSNPDGAVTSDAAKLFGALSQQTERMQAGVTTRAFNIGIHNRADLFKGTDGKTVQTTVAGMVDARVNEAVTDLTARLAVEGVQDGMEQLKPDQNIKEYKGIRGAIQYWRDTKGQAIKDRAINGLRARQYDEKDSEGNVIGQKYYTQTTGEFIMQTAQVFNTLSMATSSFQSSLDSLSQGTLTASQALGTLGSGAMAISTLSSTLFNNKKLTNAFGSMAGGFLPSLYQNLGSTALGSKLGLGVEGVLTAGGGLTSLGAAIPIALAIGALGITAKEYQEYKRNTSEARLSRANESKIALSALSKENKNKADNYLSVVSSQQQSYNKLLGLQPGTTAYTSQLLSSNAQAQELIDTYNLQAGKDYNIDENGAYYFSAEQIRNSDEQIRDQANQSMLLSQLANDKIYQLQDYANDLTGKPYGMIEAMKGRKVTLYGSESLTQSEIDNKLSTEEKMQYLAMSPEEYAKKVTGKDSGNAYDREVAAMRKDQLELQGYITAEQRAQSSYQSSLNAYISTQENITDAQRIAINLLGENSTKQREYQSELYRLSKDDLKNIKKNGKYLEVGQLQKEYLAHSDIYNLPLDRSLTNDQLGAMMESLQAQYYMKQQIEEIIEDYDLENTDISAYSSLASMSYDSFKKMITEHNGAEYQNLNIMALNKQAAAQENLAQALLHNTNLQDTNFREQSRLIQETLNLSIDQQDNLANYINNFGTNFGDNTGKAIYDALTTNGTEWNSQFYEALQNISTSSNIASIADLTYQSTLTKNADLQQSMENLRKAMVADIEDRGGLAKALFTSSDFTKVFDSLSEQYKETGSITAQNIADLAKKNDIIGQYMRASGSNEQTVADLMEMVASGDIGTEGITPALEHFVQNMNGSEGAQQEALDTLENYDFSDSITTLDKGYQNIGKVFYNARVNDVLYDNPVREALDLLLTPDDKAKFERIMAIQAYGGTTKDIMSMIQEYMPEAYAALSELEGKGKKKGKGGGGFDTAIEYWSKMGLFDGSGIEVDESTGRITFGEGFSKGYDALNGEGSQVTAQGFKDYVVNIFKKAGVSEELANTWASQVTGTLSASSFGSLFNSGALIDSVQGLWGDLTGEEALGRNLTGEQINAIFNQYREVFARLKNDNGELRELTTDELKDFENNPGITDIKEWQDYIAEQARRNGIAIIDTKGKELLNGKSASALGKAIVENSMKTVSKDSLQGVINNKITDENILGLINAAVMSGVQLYNDTQNGKFIGQSLDYNDLQRFYTDTLGLTTEDLTRHIDDLNKAGQYVTHKWTDAYGVEHNINSRDMTGSEFTQKVQHDTELTQQIIDMQRTQWITKIMNDPANANLTYQDILKKVNDKEEEQRRALEQAAKNDIRSSEVTVPTTTSSEGGGETETPEGEEETTSEGNETGTSSNGIITEDRQLTSEEIIANANQAYNISSEDAQKKVGTYGNYSYRGTTKDEKIYRYNLLHPNLTPYQAMLAVEGGADVNAEWNKEHPTEVSSSKNAYLTEEQETQAEIAKRQAILAAKDSSAYWTANAPEIHGPENPELEIWRRRQQLKKEAEEAAAKEVAKQQQEELQGNLNLRQELKALGLSDEDIDARLEKKGATLDSVYEEAVDEDIRRKEEQALAEEQAREQARLAAEKTAREQAALQDVNNIIEGTSNLGQNIYGPDGELIGGPAFDEAARTAMMTPSEYDAYKAKQGNIAKAAESLGISKEEARQFIESGFNGSYDAYKQQSNIATFNGENITAQQRFDYLNATYNKALNEGTGALSPFEKQLLTMVGEINDSTGELVTYSEEDATDAATRAKAANKIDEETGQVLDENGKPIEMPAEQSTPTSSGVGTDNGGGYYPNGTPKPTTTGGSALDKFKNYLQNGGNVTPGQGVNVNGKRYTVGVNDNGDYTLEDENGHDISGDIDLKASGQNNARLLAYASGKEGHIAVTGELGPELRVKSDGSMDILGKTGREYAWVEPDDKIYTASQSAGILKSNKIPGLEGLAKGINNFIPGYVTSLNVESNGGSNDKGGSGSGGGGSSGRGGSGGGGKGDKDPRYDPNTLKIRDILERYYTILQQVDDITKTVEHIGKAIDRGWGQERIKNLERQEKLLESQYKMQEAYVKEIKDYLKVDKDALTTMVTDFVKEYNEGKEDKDKISLKGAIYDENGVLTNYKDIVQKLVDAYNKNADANAQSKEEQYKFQERLKDIQMYTDTLNQLQEAEEKLYDLNNQILDTRIRQITYRIEYENEMDANDLKLVNFQYDQIADNAYRTAEAIDLTAQKSSYLADELHRYENGITEILGKYFDRDLTDKLVKMFYENPTQFAKEWQKIMETDPRYQDITDEHKNTLEGWMDRSIEIVKTLWDNYDKTIDKMSDDIKTFSKTLDGVLDKFDYFNSVYDSLNNIIGLTNRSLTNIDAAFMKTLSDRQLENSMNKFRGAAREVQTMNKAVAEATFVYNNALAEQINYTGNDQQTKDRLQDEVDNAKKALDIVIEQNENATKQFYDAWENCLKAIEERYKVAMQEVGRDYERSISPYFMTLELLQNQYDREKELADLYVKDYQRIHDLSKLNRDIQKSIDDTDNLKGKQRLRDLQKEINDLQENGNDLSEYDLDILQKKYDLELARQALEDAKDAKSLVRLTRDNNGNWSYVYTSNQDDVDEAEQNYEDKIRDMEQANEDYIREMQDQIVDLTAQARQALEGLNPADFASPEEFQEYLNNLIKYYQDRLDFATSQLNNAAGNNVALAPDIQRMYNNLDHNLTTNSGQTILSAMLGTQNLDDAINNIMDGINNMAGEAFKTYATIYSEMQKEVYEIAGVDIANAASGLSDIIDIIAKASAQQVDVMDKEATRIDDAYTDTINAIQAYQASLADLIGETNTMTNSLSSLNTFLHSSGEYVPTNTLYEKFQTAYKNVAGFNSGGYTGRWQYADTGMYTGEWPDGSNRRNGRLAWLHQKELVLNAHDTENFLDAMEIVRQLDNLTNWMANGLGDLVMPNVSGDYGELEQNVHIEAEFPNVTDHNEIEQAFTNLVNMASQYANRK